MGGDRGLSIILPAGLSTVLGCTLCSLLCSQVRGEAVVGHYPLLKPGEQPLMCMAPTLSLGGHNTTQCNAVRATLLRPLSRSCLPPSPQPPLHPHLAECPLYCPAGAPDFVYQSCTHQREPAGSMEGSFVFVEGTLQVGACLLLACWLLLLH